jgi:hypothetical protein
MQGDTYIESYAIQKQLASRGGKAPGKAWVPSHPSAKRCAPAPGEGA